MNLNRSYSTKVVFKSLWVYTRPKKLSWLKNKAQNVTHTHFAQYIMHLGLLKDLLMSFDDQYTAGDSLRKISTYLSCCIDHFIIYCLDSLVECGFFSRWSLTFGFKLLTAQYNKLKKRLLCFAQWFVGKYYKQGWDPPKIMQYLFHSEWILLF